MSIRSRLCSTSVRYRTDAERTFLLTALANAAATPEGPLCDVEDWTRGCRLFLYMTDPHNLDRLVTLITAFHHRFQIKTPWTITGHARVSDGSPDTTPKGSPQVYYCIPHHEVPTFPAGPEQDQQTRLSQHAPTLLAVLKDVLHALETPGDYTDIERQALIDDVLSAICSCDPAFSPQPNIEDT